MLSGSGQLPVLGLPGGRLLVLAERRGRRRFTEAFPDRGYTEGDDGIRRLLPRDRDGAVFTDPEEIARRAVSMAPGVDSVCVHGDGPSAVAAARAVRASLHRAGFLLRAFT